MTTTEEMNLKIQSAIKESLPHQVGEALQQRLKEAAETEHKLEKLTLLLENTEKELRVAHNRISDYVQHESRYAALNEKQKTIEEKERNQKVFEAELKAAAAEARANEMVGFVGMVFKSPVFRNSTYGNTPMLNSQYGIVSQHFNKTEETTQE